MSAGRGRPGLAALLLVLGSTMAMLLVFGETTLRQWQSLTAWKPGMPPLAHLRQHGAMTPIGAQAALMAELYSQGLIASMQASDWAVARHVFDEPPSVLHATLAGPGGPLLTSDGTRVFAWAPSLLPHEALTVARFTDAGLLVSASRTEFKTWRQGQPVSQKPLQAAYDPMAIADDGLRVLAPAGDDTLEVLDLRPGRSALRLEHTTAVTAACAYGPWIATGTRDGEIQVWSAQGERLWRWSPYVGRVSLLVCRGDRLLSAGVSTRKQMHALLWDLQGRPQPAQAAVVAPREWPLPWHLQALKASGWDAGRFAAVGLPQFDRIGDLAQPVGVGLWLLTLVGAGWLWRAWPARR